MTSTIYLILATIFAALVHADWKLRVSYADFGDYNVHGLTNSGCHILPHEGFRQTSFKYTANAFSNIVCFATDYDCQEIYDGDCFADWESGDFPYPTFYRSYTIS